jgi:hypothetical protein
MFEFFFAKIMGIQLNTHEYILGPPQSFHASRRAYWSAMDRMEQYVRLGISEAPLAPSSFRSYKITGCLDHGWLETNFSNQSD